MCCYLYLHTLSQSPVPSLEDLLDGSRSVIRLYIFASYVVNASVLFLRDEIMQYKEKLVSKAQRPYVVGND